MQNENEALTLTDKLLMMYSHRGDGLPTQYVNPDGPEAVAELERLTSDAAKAREAAIEECASHLEGISKEPPHLGDTGQALARQIAMFFAATAIRALKASTSDSVGEDG